MSAPRSSAPGGSDGSLMRLDVVTVPPVAWRELVLDDLPSREPRLEVVPERDAIPFAELPAEIDLAAAALGAEIDEPLLRILHLGAELGDLAEERLDLARDRVRRP